MKRYNKYKDSGIAWLGLIPEHWEVRKLKRILSLVTERGVSPKKLALENIESYTGRYLPTDSIFDGDGVQIHVGDIVYGKLRPYLCKVWLASFACNAIGDFYVFRCNYECSNQFVSYLFRSTSFTGICNASTYGAKMPRVSSDFMLSMSLPLPPLPEQEAIVSYLDRKVSEMDSFVSKQETQISYLKELKQATIAKAVTRGIDPSVALKDSGIPWLGQIPEHWEVDKLGLHFKERNEKVSDKDYPALSVSKEGITLQLDSVAKTENGDNRKKVCKGDFVANSRSDRKGSCGFSDYEGSVSLISIVITPLGLNPKFYHFLFRSHNYIEEFYRLGRGIVADLWTTRYIDMKNIMIPLPPLSEQAAIVSYLEEKLGAIDRLISASEAAIARVRELKQTLIADVVTGRICVQPS